MEKVCENCTYFCVDNDESTLGDCRRFPPQIYTLIDVYEGSGRSESCRSFPVVERQEWCGEFKEVEKMLVRAGTEIDDPGLGRLMLCDNQGKVLPGSSFEQ